MSANRVTRYIEPRVKQNSIDIQYPGDAKYKLQIRLDVQIHTNKATKKAIERATYPGDAELMLQFSLLLPKLNQVPFSSSIAVFSMMISFSWPLQSALSAFVQHGILFHFGVSSLCTRARSQVRCVKSRESSKRACLAYAHMIYAWHGSYAWTRRSKM